MDSASLRSFLLIRFGRGAVLGFGHRWLRQPQRPAAEDDGSDQKLDPAGTGHDPH
jgi:hypothetical protein